MPKKPTRSRSKAHAEARGGSMPPGPAAAPRASFLALDEQPGAGVERSIRTSANAAKICDAIAQGRSLKEVCAAAGMPDRDAVRRWLLDDQPFHALYARAREVQGFCVVDDIIELADSAKGQPAAEVQAIRLAIDTRKWAASKLWPRKYGDRGEQSMPITLNLPADMTTAAGIAAAADAILRAVSAGNMSPSEGAALAGILETRRRAIETEDLERRLAALETKGAPA